MDKTFNKLGILSQSYKIARAQALPMLPYFVIVAVIITGLYALSGVSGGADVFQIELLIILVESILLTSVAVLFYLRALKRDNPSALLFRDTRNVFWATLLVTMLFLIMGFLLGLFLSVFAGILLANDGFDPEAFQGDSAEIAAEISQFLQQPEGIILGIMTLIALAVLAWLAARLVLFGVTSAASGRVRVFETWGWTRGHALPIMLTGAVMSFLPLLVATVGVLSFDNLLISSGIDLLLSNLINDALSYVLLYPAFLFGHGFAVAVFKELSPELVDVEDAFG